MILALWSGLILVMSPTAVGAPLDVLPVQGEYLAKFTASAPGAWVIQDWDKRRFIPPTRISEDTKSCLLSAPAGEYGAICFVEGGQPEFGNVVLGNGSGPPPPPPPPPPPEKLYVIFVENSRARTMVIATILFSERIRQTVAGGNAHLEVINTTTAVGKEKSWVAATKSIPWMFLANEKGETLVSRSLPLSEETVIADIRRYLPAKRVLRTHADKRALSRLGVSVRGYVERVYVEPRVRVQPSCSSGVCPTHNAPTYWVVP
jgi:hypothetical protein